MRHLFTILAFCIVVSFQAHSQCVPPVTPPVLSCGTGTVLQDNANINTGETHYFDGTGGSFTNISINGGTLLICGSATITNINFNSGSLVVNSGGAVTFNGSFNAGDNNFFNSGTVVFNQSINLQGSNTFVYNAAGASMTVNGSLTVFNSGLLINNGAAIAQQININSGASICLGPSSYSAATDLQNNQANAVSVPSGTACVSYSNSFTGNSAITADAGMSICQQAGASAPAPAVIGAATVTSNCVSCSAVLPLKLLSFKGSQEGTKVELEWITAWEENVKSFIIERSRDRQIFETLSIIAAHNQPSKYKFVTHVDADSYFRLKMVDEDGATTYSSILLMRLLTKGYHLSVPSNPLTHSYALLSVDASHNDNGELVIMDNMGRTIRRMPALLIKGGNTVHLDLNGMIAGQYYLFFRGKNERSEAITFIKL